ncbi:glycosyltransferase family 2 protein [Actinoplanes utahensis]|uniref:glycosyltransferase family 2 protein n=1 Tax=Actinoplanes utahensis TaxID=1869 RepID=UPI0007C77D8F|nr:glycosyltransferase family 2 protein [Actinoplanes utahensis]GIF34864.1 hypothetical protein Aut01nite_78500 [Actinoplanes utahensis]
MVEAQPVELLDDHVRLAGPGAEVSLPHTALRNRSIAARRVLARAAGITLEDALDAARAGDTRRIRRPVDPRLLAALAQTIAGQDELPTDRDDALALYALIRTGRGARALPAAHQALHVQLVYAWQGPGNARQLLGAYRRIPAAAREAIETDLANPHAGGQGEEETWLARFGALFPAPAPALVAAPERTPFDRLTGSAGHPAETAGERVSVVVPVCRPGEELLTAVRSVAAQSWPDLEIIVVDGGSPPEHDAVLAAAEDLDPRVRLIRLPRGDARNAGLAAARGDFVTFQDPGDWSHPRRIELQVRPLLTGAAVASTAERLTVTERLVLTRPGVRRRAAVPSLLFRREAVTRRIGWFDEVPTGADALAFDEVPTGADALAFDEVGTGVGAEYLERIETAFGPGSVVRLDQALALTRSESRAHGMHPARAAYQSAYRCWHATARPLHRARADQPFPAPVRRCDVVVAADWRFLTGAQRSALAEIRALRDAGHTVAILHLESLRSVHRQRRPLSAGIQRLINTGRLDQVLETDPVDAGVVLVRQPEVLQFAAEDGCRIRPRRVVVVADRAPSRRDGSDRRYTETAVTQAATRLFGTPPVWYAQDAAVRDILTDAFTLPVVAESVDVARPLPDPRGPAVVGADLCDAGEWPGDLAEVLAVLRRCPTADVRVRLPESPLRPSGLPASWLVYEPADVDPRTFAAQIDFYLHYPPEQAAETMSRPALEAAATGCVVLVPERLAEAFGDIAVPCPADQVPDLVRAFHQDPARYAVQSARARAAIARDHRPEDFAARLLCSGAPAPAQRARNGAGINPVTSGESY